MMVRCCFALVLIWMCRQAITDDDMIVTEHGEVERPSVAGSCYTSPKYDVTKANLGRAFFRHLIRDNDSFKNVNEDNVCSLIHFFIQEAAHNGRPIRFSSG